MSASIKTKNKLSIQALKGFIKQNSVVDWIGALGSDDIGVDIGTSNIVLYVKHKGILLPEACVVAKNTKTGKFFAHGTKAEEMEGKTPPEIEIIRPLAHSTVLDYKGISYLLNALVNQSYFKGILFHPRLMICVPAGISGVQKRALLEIAVSIGARKTVLIDQPLAAMMGMGVSMDNREGMMIVDIGGGSTKISVLSQNGIVLSDLSYDCGEDMDHAIIHEIASKYHVRIGRKVAESLKISLGVEWDLDKVPRVAEVFGLSLISGNPVKIAVTGEDVAQALNPILYKIFQNIQKVLQKIPPSLLKDIKANGISLIGGVAQLKGLDALITNVTGVEAVVSHRPAYVNAVGAGSALKYINDFRDSLQDLH